MLTLCAHKLEKRMNVKDIPTLSTHNCQLVASLVNRPLTNRSTGYITSPARGGKGSIWHKAHTKLVLVQEKLHQLCGQLWLASSDPQQYVMYGVYSGFRQSCKILKRETATAHANFKRLGCAVAF